MGGELVLQITQGAEDGCVSRVLCYRYSNRFFSAPWADEYRGELLLHNPDYPTSSPPQSTLLYTVRRSRLNIYLWFGCCCQTFVIPDQNMGFVGNKRLSLFTIRYGVRMDLHLHIPVTSQILIREWAQYRHPG